MPAWTNTPHRSGAPSQSGQCPRVAIGLCTTCHPGKDNQRESIYQRISSQALRRFRTKQGWEPHYGWNRPYGKRCTVCIIDPKFWRLIERVGCENAAGDHNDLGSTLLPLQIRTIYEVTWYSQHLHDSTWRKIFENGSWIPHANTNVSGFNAVNASHWASCQVEVGFIDSYHSMRTEPSQSSMQFWKD